MIYDKKEEYEDLREIRASLRTKEGFFLLALLQLPVITTTALTTITKKFNHHSLKHEGSVDDDLMAKSKQQNAKIYVISLSVALLFFSSGMEGFFALGRFGAIFAATSFSNGFILLCDTTGCLVSYCVLYTLQGSTIGLYCGVALFGLFLSTVSPTTISLTEQFFDIGPIATSCLVVGAGFGEMLYPVFMGNVRFYDNDHFLMIINEKSHKN
uniref:Uncharacterized protein n=1 Tax=Romanomermis culicivorax TaxID=13658 RepID=A0A915HF23_ROMCU